MNPILDPDRLLQDHRRRLAAAERTLAHRRNVTIVRRRPGTRLRAIAAAVRSAATRTQARGHGERRSPRISSAVDDEMTKVLRL